MSKRTDRISDLIRVPNRFLRSVQLERDFHDVDALQHYVLTSTMADAFSRVVNGLRENSGRRAWRVTGDYGVGKSSFALVLAHLLHDQRAKGLSKISASVGRQSSGNPKLFPILITGTREAFVPAIARGIAESLARLRPARGKVSKQLSALLVQAGKVSTSGDTRKLEEFVETVRSYVWESEGAGLLLLVDELGKLLEYAAQSPGRDEVFVLQRLAEMASRSGKRPMLFVGLLHQGFQAYAERLPSAARHEWEKVASRFDEIVFDQPLAHSAALISSAINIDEKRLAPTVRKTSRELLRTALATGWLGAGNAKWADNDGQTLYPLHPLLLPVLVRFFSRFGQHERSLFSFLLSSEPFGLQAFADRPATSGEWYDLACFYDYVRTLFGHRLAGESYRTNWSRIVATVESGTDLTPLQERVLKVVAILSLLDAEDLVASDRAIRSAVAPGDEAAVGKAIRTLLDRNLLYKRGANGGYRLWSTSSVNLDELFRSAHRRLGNVETVAGNLRPFLDHEPLLARRHYIESGTLRYFEVRYARPHELVDVISAASDADGLVAVVLADTEAERQEAIRHLQSDPLARRKELIASVPQPLISLSSELQDLRCWQWVVENTPELADDAYASVEVARYLAAARRTLNGRLNELIGLRDGSATEVMWLRSGKSITLPKRGHLTALLSDICDDLFPEAPRINNELINRNSLSSAAAAARMRLIEGLFNSADQPFLGIHPTKAPPEKSMYFSVFGQGGLHVMDGDSYVVSEPPPNKDALHLRPVLSFLVEELQKARGDRVSVLQLLESVRFPPFGIRKGVAPLLLAILLKTHAHELAVYEHGTFLHRFGGSDFMRLIKAPVSFEIQHCKVAGVRAEVFHQLAAIFAPKDRSRPIDLLDVVRPLCEFAAQLPEYTRRAGALGESASKVRDALLSAREPATLLFKELPEACDQAPFDVDQKAEPRRVKQFVTALSAATDELRAAYPDLLNRIIERVAEAVGENRASFDRARLATRAAQVSLAVREPRLRSFALRLRDLGLSEEAWAEALASFVVSKPPSRWIPGDEVRFCEEIAALAELFYRMEATAFDSTQEHGDQRAIRLNLTRGDGEDLIRILHPHSGDDAAVGNAVQMFTKLLPQDSRLRLNVLARLLWEELEKTPSTSEDDKRTTSNKVEQSS